MNKPAKLGEDGMRNGCLTKEQAYIVGFITGDGNLSKSQPLIRMYDSDKHFTHNVLKPLFNRAFNKMPRVIYDKHNNGYVVYSYSKRIWNTLKQIGIPTGAKSRIVRVPLIIKKGIDEIKSSYIAALFDAEGSTDEIIEQKRHPRGYIYFQLKMYNPTLINQIAELLHEIIGIKPRTYHYDYGSILRINGPRQVKRCLKYLNVKHPRFSFILI